MTIALAPSDVVSGSARHTTTAWHIITGEYPPAVGGVADYTQLVARGLAASGDAVTVWTPSEGGADESGVTVRVLPDCYGLRSLRVLSREIDSGTSTRILVQYVPHAFGWKGGNLPFCLWLRLRRRDRPWVMFHEVAYPFDESAPFTLRALAVVNRVMARLVSRAAHRAFVSIPAWRTDVQALASADTSIEWLPVPSTLPVVDDPEGTNAVRLRYAPHRPLVGSFGTFGHQVRALLRDCLPLLAARSDATVLLLGRNSNLMADEIRVAHPDLARRVFGTGSLTTEQLSIHIRACDVMLQPYPDGVSTRRTSAMAALTHERALVTTAGTLTEAFWALDHAAVLMPAGDPVRIADAVVSLLADASRRAVLGARALALYRGRFDVAHTIKALRRPA
jgi:glycosyltransferase involved in cell wall biosynthesis